jgi:type IV pilus modification protein PilV
MIEVLIALALVAVTMLGLLGLQLRSMSSQKDSIDRRTAAILVSGFGERMTGNFAGFEGSLYSNLVLNPPGSTANDTPPTPGACAVTTSCTAAEISARDWALFANEVRNRLPGGVAFVNTAADLSRADVIVGWLDVGRVAAGEDPANVTAGVVNRDPVCPNTAEFTAAANRRYRCYIAAVHP